MRSATTDTTGVVQLVAGQRYAIKIEYYENTGTARMQLRWRPPGTSTYVVIPIGQLFPGAAPPPAVPGTGLAGSYFNGITPGSAPVFTRTEAIDFDWGAGSPGAGVNPEKFSARWTGSVMAPVTGSYRFRTLSNDGVRVWVNGATLIDNWTDHGVTTNTSAPVTLAGGQRYTITVEYYENVGTSVIRLQWLTPSTGSYVAVPPAQLYTD